MSLKCCVCGSCKIYKRVRSYDYRCLKCGVVMESADVNPARYSTGRTPKYLKPREPTA